MFMAASNIIVATPAFDCLSLPLRPLAKWLRLTPSALSVVVLSLVGGYPIGARMIAEKVRMGELSPTEGERMLCYCVNSGPAFLISGVGVAILGSMKAGVMLYFSQLLACITVAVFMRGRQIIGPRRSPLTTKSAPTIFVDAIGGAVRGMAMVCGMVVVFAAVNALLGAVVPQQMMAYVNGVLEVTTAVRLSPDTPYPLLFAGAVTAFGGICIMLQIAAMLSGTGVRVFSGRFLSMRLVYAAVSMVYLRIMLWLDPSAASCITMGDTVVQTDATSPVGVMFLLLLCIMLLFFTRKSDKI